MRSVARAVLEQRCHCTHTIMTVLAVKYIFKKSKVLVIYIIFQIRTGEHEHKNPEMISSHQAITVSAALTYNQKHSHKIITKKATNKSVLFKPYTWD